MSKIESWQQQMGVNAVSELNKDGIINNPESWNDKMADITPNWLFFELNKRVSESINKTIQDSIKTMHQFDEVYIDEFTITAYDLSVASCGKALNDPQYGITASGFSLKDKTWEQAMTVAADASFPFGTKLRLEFIDKDDIVFDGIYSVMDRGGAIKGNKLDLFIGDFKSNTASPEALKFGVKKCRVFKQN